MAENEIYRDVWQQLYLRGYKPKKVLRVESAGDSLTGDTTVVFVNANKQAMTAYIGCELIPKKKFSDADDYRLIIAVVPGMPIEIPA